MNGRGGLHMRQIYLKDVSSRPDTPEVFSAELITSLWSRMQNIWRIDGKSKGYSFEITEECWGHFRKACERPM